MLCGPAVAAEMMVNEAYGRPTARSRVRSDGPPIQYRENILERKACSS